MRKRVRSKVLAAIVIGSTLGVPFASEAGPGRGRGRGFDQKQARGSQDDAGRRNSASRVYQDPATAKGYDYGYERGLTDGREGQRYDPVRHRDYRDAERGYVSNYGSRDGYRTNFRTGFRQGYETGYREGTRAR